MSYSYLLPVGSGSDVEDRVQAQVADVTTGTSQDEARAHAPVAAVALRRLAEDQGFVRFTATVAGHGYDGFTSLTVSVTRDDGNDA